MAGFLSRLLGKGRAAGGDPPAMSANDKVRAALREHGDDGTRVRHVIHFAYPVSEDAAGQQDARDAVDWIGPRFTQTDEATGIVFEHEREVASAAFDAMTDRFGADLSAIGWTYDGWECAVETGETR